MIEMGKKEIYQERLRSSSQGVLSKTKGIWYPNKQMKQVYQRRRKTFVKWILITLDKKLIMRFNNVIIRRREQKQS